MINGEGQLIVENVDGAYDLKPVYVPTQEDVGKQVRVFVKVIGEMSAIRKTML